MTTLQTVIEAARSLNFLDSKGQLVQLDSLGMIDLITELEDATGIVLPAASLREEYFTSLEKVAQLFDQFTKG